MKLDQDFSQGGSSEGTLSEHVQAQLLQVLRVTDFGAFLERKKALESFEKAVTEEQINTGLSWAKSEEREQAEARMEDIRQRNIDKLEWAKISIGMLQEKGMDSYPTNPVMFYEYFEFELERHGLGGHRDSYYKADSKALGFLADQMHKVKWVQEADNTLYEPKEALEYAETLKDMLKKEGLTHLAETFFDKEPQFVKNIFTARDNVINLIPQVREELGLRDKFSLAAANRVRLNNFCEEMAIDLDHFVHKEGVDQKSFLQFFTEYNVLLAREFANENVRDDKKIDAEIKALNARFDIA